MVRVKSSKQVRERAVQTLHLKVREGEEVTQFREWRETPQSQSDKPRGMRLGTQAGARPCWALLEAKFES